MNLTRPLFKSTRSTHQREDISPWDAYAPAYSNRVCCRSACRNIKPIATASMACAACGSLPMCEECGDFACDCTCADREPEVCRGCEDGCELCCPSLCRRSSHRGERFGYDG